MSSIQSYYELWCKKGRTDSSLSGSAYPHCTPTQLITILLHITGVLSALDLRSSRLLYDATIKDKRSDEPLQLLLIMLHCSQAQGSLFLPTDVEQLALCYLETISQGLHLAQREDSISALLRKNGLVTQQNRTTEMLHQFCTQSAIEVTRLAEEGFYSSILGPFSKPIVRTDGGWYFEKYYLAESRLGELLRSRFLLKGGRPDDDLLVRSVMAQTAFPKLHPLQRTAIALACLEKTIIIAGGPGTGKTTVVTHALRALMARDPQLDPQEDIIIAAPTGRAAARLQESIAEVISRMECGDQRDQELSRLRGRTIHSLLGYDPISSGFTRNATHRLDARILVIDEISMLDIALFRRLLEAVSDETTLILLGDRNQLPSVDAGAVLGDIAAPFYEESREPDAPLPSLSRTMIDRLWFVLGEEIDSRLISKRNTLLTDRFIVLTHSFRSVQSISFCAHAVNAQVPAITQPFRFEATHQLFSRISSVVLKDDGVFGVGAYTDSVCRQWVEAYFGMGYVEQIRNFTEVLQTHVARTGVPDKGRIPAVLEKAGLVPAIAEGLQAVFSYLDRAIILCVLRKGETGSIAVNRSILQMLRSQIDPESTSELFHGGICMVTRNQPECNVWNGDRGIILEINGRRWVALRRGDRYQFLAREEVSSLEPAFAMTVHKSQGSEFDRVLVVLPPIPNHCLLTKEILYTALTRAKRQAFVAGLPEVFDSAVGSSVRRRSGLMDHLR